MLGTSADLAADLLDHLDQAVWVLDPDGSIVDLNPAAAGVLGQVPGEAVGASFRDFLEPAPGPEAWRDLIERASSAPREPVVVRFRHRVGHVMAYELSLFRHRTVRHDVVLVVGRPRRVGIPATPATQALIDTVNDGIAVIGPGGRIDAVNASFCRLVGHAADRLVGRSVFDPPWTTYGEDGEVVPPERSAPVLALRSGTAVRSPLRRIDRPGAAPAWIVANARPVDGPDGSANGALVVLWDRTPERRAADEKRRLLDTDSLTGLASRSRIHQVVSDALGSAPAAGRLTAADQQTAAEEPEVISLRDLDSGEQHLSARTAPSNRTPDRVGLLHVDLDNFRMVNDTFGTVVGDRVLAEVADRLRDLEDRRVTIGRLGVDELLVVVTSDGPTLAFDTRLRRLAEEVQRRIRAPFNHDGLEVRLTASVGVARTPADGSTVDELTTAADRALRTARAEGRGRLRFHDPALDERTRAGLRLDRDLRLAAAQRGLDVHYQPILDLRTGAVAAAEALVRWHHPEQGPIPPSVFIPTAEATGAISAVSDLVLHTVVEDVARWSGEDLLPADARIAVNISAAEFEQRHFTERLAQSLADAGVSPAQLELEITESLLVQDLEAAADRLAELDALGFLIALDDFGTGYSSLSYLHSLPLHTLKIDRRFVVELGDGRSGTITRAILTLAHNLGIVAVAEGVETEAQRQFLATAGCDLVQGYLFAPPLPRPAFERFLREHRAGIDLPFLQTAS